MAILRTCRPAGTSATTRLTIPSFALALLSLAQTSIAQETCVSISGSKACPAYNTSQISTDATLVGYFPFLANVTDTASFDSALLDYASNVYPIFKYQNTFGCTNINPSNTTDIYARYTVSFICNSIVQNSLAPCGIPADSAPPICASSCAEFAQSEQEIVSSPELCDSPNANVMDLLRADFTNCAQPSEAISDQCILASANEANNCGFGNNLSGLCNFCASSTVNSTDSCCVTSDSETRCSNVELPVYGSAQPQITVISTASANPTSGAAAGSGPPGTSSAALSGGQIAGVVIGSIAGAALIIGIVVIGCLLARRRRPMFGEKSSFLNQPTPPRSGGTAASRPSGTGEAKFEAIPNARVTRMTALEAPSHGSPVSGQIQNPRDGLTPGDVDGTSAATAGALGVAAGRKGGAYSPLRDGEVSTGGSSPNGTDSSPENGNMRSEQMDAFKDYYSQDDIHPGDTVSTLWAYQPRADDEFELERGDMLRIVGIWDDGWATGVRVSGRAEEWDPERNATRDSAMSNNEPSGDSPPTNGNVKAFPHWSKTVEGESEQASGENSPDESQR